MKLNMGYTDRFIRILIALIIAGLHFGGIISGTLGLVLAVLAGIFAVTSTLGVCPLYSLFRIRTTKETSEV